MKVVAVALLATSIALPTTTAVARSVTGGGVSATAPYNGDAGKISVYDGSTKLVEAPPPRSPEPSWLPEPQ
jgi:hypothetical protein